MSEPSGAKRISLDTRFPVWERFFMVSPLVVIATKEPGQGYDLAPKHMVSPMAWENYFGFVCTPIHATYRNIQREKAFTVSFPMPEQVVLTSLSASPRCEDGCKPSLAALPTSPAETIDGVFLTNSYVSLECRLERIIDGFARNSLIVGQIVAAQVAEPALRTSDQDDQDVLARAPLLAYVHPGRYATIDSTLSFPFPSGFKRGNES